MVGSTMYKGAAQNAQHARDRLKLSALATKGLPEVQTLEDRHRNVQRRLTQLHAQIKALLDGQPWGWQARKRELASELQALNEESRQLKALLKGKRCSPANFERHFVDVAKERLSRPEFAIWCREAQTRASSDP
jgi:hypothetical protein